jgi:hypothetical protein
MAAALPVLAIVATVGSTVMSAIGQSQAASAQAGQANYMAQVARRNQQINEWNAARTEEQGRVASDLQRQKTAQIVGSQRAALASQGADINSGSPLDIQTDTERAGEFDALTIKSNAALQAFGYRTKGAEAASQAGLYDMTAANATANLPFAMGSTLLSGASSVAGKYASWQRGGGGGKGIGSFGSEFDL